MKKFLSLLVVFGGCLCVASLLVYAQPVSLGQGAEGGVESLLFADIPVVNLATITKTDRNKIPASVTIITKEQIEITPARNIFDLIEVYVPGAFWMIHNSGTHVGIRGINVDRNYKLLILVNGRKMNEDNVNGAITEFEMWDLNDIERIEVVRGPGSVTYGPGAIEGVVNVVTKNAATSPGTNAGVQYVDDYNSRGIYLSHGMTKENFDLYLYGSAVSTKGMMPRAFVVDTTNRVGYAGLDVNKGLEVQDYFRDWNDVPQGKLHAELNFLKEWKLWARYTNWGATLWSNGATGSVKYADGQGETLNSRQYQGRMVVAALENNHDFSDTFNLNSILSWSSADFRKRNSGSGVYDHDSLSNMPANFAERELNIKTIGSYSLAEHYNFATGLAWAHKNIGPGWHDTLFDFKADGYGSAEGMVAFGATSGKVVNKGWNTDRLSWLGEANLGFHKLFNLILSGRTDHHSYAGTTFSPRVAASSDFGKAGILRIIFQKSVRFNSEGELFLNSESGSKSKPETLRGWEFIYEVKPQDKLTLTSAFFANELEVIGWSGTTSSTGVLGALKILGFDLEAKYQTERLTLGVNQSLAKQQSFELGDGVARSGISAADYNYTTGGLSYLGEGNDLNNWSNWATKLYVDVKATPKITLHADTKILWGFEGMQDVLDMWEQGTTYTDDVIQHVYLDTIKDKDALKMDFRFNFAVKYAPTKNISTVVFVQNLLGCNDNKRYGYDGSTSAAAPSRLHWVEEPRVWGVKVNCKF